VETQVLVSEPREPSGELPKPGSRIAVQNFHVSTTNVNFDESFGESDKDKKLIANFRAGSKIVQPFKARPEGKRFGVYIGRRRFLANKEAGAKFFMVGADCLINNVTDEEAEEASWIENYRDFQKGMRPITRAKRLDKIVSRCGLREYSRRSGIPPSTLSTYLSVLELSPKMRHLLTIGKLTFTDSVSVARMKLDTRTQDKLAGVLMIDGLQAFRKEFALLTKSDKKQGKKQRKKRKRRRPALSSDTPPTELTTKGESDSFDKHFWRELTEPLKEFFNYWSDYSELKEWQDDEAYHLVLEVTVPKDLKQKSSETHDSHATSVDDVAETCSACGKKIPQGQKLKKIRGFPICRECADKEPSGA